MQLDPQTIRKLAKLTLATKPDEIGCGDWIHRVGEYVEATRRGERLDERLRTVERHAAQCPECAQELEVLRALVEEPDGGV